LRPGQLIVLESSVAPGTTRKVVLPILQETGLTVEVDFFLAFSPERIDPGNQNFPFTKIPKVVAGYGERSTSLVYEFYSRIVTLAYAVSSLETAEMAKILENTFRLVNISLVNELKTYTSAIGVDIWEVINAAKTKPFGFLTHYPGPGIGGHCIPVDPHYLREDAERLGIPLKSFGFAGNKDRNAVTEQKISIFRGSKNFENVELSGIGLKYLGNGKEPISLGDLEGNEFEIIIRNLDGKEIKKIQKFKNILATLGKKRSESN